MHSTHTSAYPFFQSEIIRYASARQLKNHATTGVAAVEPKAQVARGQVTSGKWQRDECQEEISNDNVQTPKKKCAVLRCLCALLFNALMNAGLSDSSGGFREHWMPA